MTIKIIIFTILMLITVLYSFFEGNRDNVLKKRKEQAQNMFRENVLKKKIDEITKDRVKINKRYKIETLCLQAGLNWDYSQYVLVSIATALIISFSVAIGMNNIFLAVVFLFVGYSLPKQVITFIRNRRVELLEKQIGSFLNMVIERYNNLKNMGEALELTLKEFKGEDPMYSELLKTVNDIKNVAKPVSEALDELARRTGNKFMQRFADYYKIASEVGTEEIRKNLLTQALIQYNEHQSIKLKMKKELAGPKREAYIMLATIPLFALYQIATNDKYIDFMTNTLVGQIGTTVIAIVFIGCFWFINQKIGAPLE